MKLSYMMVKVLIDILEGRGTHYDCRGQSEHGGRGLVLKALQRRLLIEENHRLTDLGRRTAEDLH